MGWCDKVGSIDSNMSEVQSKESEAWALRLGCAFERVIKTM